MPGFLVGRPGADFLRVTVVGRARCEARDEAGTGTRLEFGLELDQTELPGIARGLDEVVRAYPVKGEADA